MKYVIDRFEEGLAVLEDENGDLSSVSSFLIPKEAVEGDIIVYDGESFFLDREASENRKSEMENRLAALFKRNTEKDGEE